MYSSCTSDELLDVTGFQHKTVSFTDTQCKMTPQKKINKNLVPELNF